MLGQSSADGTSLLRAQINRDVFLVGIFLFKSSTLLLVDDSENTGNGFTDRFAAEVEEHYG